MDTDPRAAGERAGLSEKSIRQLTEGGSAEKVQMGPQPRDPLSLVSEQNSCPLTPFPQGRLEFTLAVAEVWVLLRKKKSREPKNIIHSSQETKLWRVREVNV